MKTSNPLLLAEIDTLEEVTRKDANDLEVVKEIEKLKAINSELQLALDSIVDGYSAHDVVCWTGFDLDFCQEKIIDVNDKYNGGL